MTNNTWNDLLGAFLAGVAFTLTIVAIFQIGLNIGIRTVMNLLDGEYPAAFKFLERNKKIARMLPYVIGGHNE